MNKKILTTTLALLYMVLSSGVAISIYYCRGELKEININSNLESCCCGNSVISKACCHVKQFKLELDIDQQIVSLSNKVPKNLVSINYFNNSLGILKELEIEETITENYNLPPPRLEAIWLTNCSLTFYG